MDIVHSGVSLMVRRLDYSIRDFFLLVLIYVRCLGSGPWTQDTVLPGNWSLDFGYCNAWELVPGLLDMYYKYRWIIYARYLVGVTLIVNGITLHC